MTAGGHLPFLGLYMDKPLEYVIHGQCGAIHVVTFPAIGHHCPITITVPSLVLIAQVVFL